MSAVRQDRAALLRLLRRKQRTFATSTCNEALGRLSRRDIDLVVCDSDLPDGTWRDILSHIRTAADPPLLVVTAPTDERLWAEVINLGGFDVIAKPFDPTEVKHVVETAWIRRRDPAGSMSLAQGE